MTTPPEAHIAADLLAGWAAGDHEAIISSHESVARESTEIMDALRELQGDARALLDEIEAEFTTLVDLTRGALYIAREAIDLALDPPTTNRLLDRRDTLERIIDD